MCTFNSARSEEHWTAATDCPGFTRAPLGTKSNPMWPFGYRSDEHRLAKQQAEDNRAGRGTNQDDEGDEHDGQRGASAPSPPAFHDHAPVVRTHPSPSAALVAAAPADALDRAGIRVVNRLSAHAARLVEPHSPGFSLHPCHASNFGVTEDGLDQVLRAVARRPASGTNAVGLTYAPSPPQHRSTTKEKRDQ